MPKFVILGNIEDTITMPCGKKYEGDRRTVGKLVEMHTKHSKCGMCHSLSKNDLGGLDTKTMKENGINRFKNKGNSDSNTIELLVTKEDKKEFVVCTKEERTKHYQ